MNTKNVCKNCRFWERQETKPQGRCTNEHFIYNRCNLSDERIRDALVYWDYEEYSAGFLTGENFGCIHFVAKLEAQK